MENVVQLVGVVESERIVSYIIYAHLVGVCVVGVVFGVVKVVCRFPRFIPFSLSFANLFDLGISLLPWRIYGLFSFFSRDIGSRHHFRCSVDARLDPFFASSLYRFCCCYFLLPSLGNVRFFPLCVVGL